MKNKDETHIYEHFMLVSTMIAIYLIIATDMNVIQIPRIYIAIFLVIIFIIFIIKSMIKFSMQTKEDTEYEYDTEIRAPRRIFKSNNIMKRR